MVEVWDQVDFSGRLAKSLGKVAMMALRRPTLVGAGMVAATRPPARQTAVRAELVEKRTCPAISHAALRTYVDPCRHNEITDQ